MDNNTEVKKLFHIFKSDNCYFVFDTIQNKITTISKSCYDFFTTHRLLEKDRLFLMNLLSKSKDIKFISNNDNSIINLNYSNKCNLKCKYCFHQNRPIYNMSIEDIYKVIDWSIDYFNVDAKKYIFNLDYNGEILLDFKKLKNIQEYLNNKSMSINKECLLNFMSNGTVDFNDEMLSFIKDSKMTSFEISLDGDKSSNDKTRITKFNNSIFDKTILGIQILQRYGIKVTVQCALSKYNINNIFENFQFFEELNINNIKFYLVKNIDDKMQLTINDIAIALSEFDKVYDKLFYDIKNNDFSMFFMLINSPMLNPLIKIKDNVLQSKRCGWMENITIDEKKDIYPCNYFVGNEKFKLGNIENYDVIYNELNKGELQIDNLEPCKHCWAKYLCGGTCYYSSYVNNGDIHKKDDIECMFKKGLIERALGFYGRLVEADLWDKVLEHLK